ncbi:hypothetical protein [Acetobacter sp. P1H12_c]|uniref:hypothetical protein n=1 Tax=Acetobacter sp. P1H12_c TaxID=2762621 RepID=UPI001C057F8D|nr:hypothetical protein [Acetobacter sp. P1H12_c]
MRRVVEYRNLTFASSDDGILQIWFEAQCDEENLLVRIYGQSRDTSFERITPQVLTGWALYRSSKPKGLVSGIYASLRPQGVEGHALAAVECHLNEARAVERLLFLDDMMAASATGSTGLPMSFRDMLRHFSGGKNAE